MGKLSETLRSRGFVNQFSAATLEEITDGPQRTVYLGVDPTAESIHVGNLAAYMMLRHFANAGHKVILILGGGTGMIGDPKPDVERPLLAPEVIEQRVLKLRSQASTLLGGEDVLMVNNADWLAKLNLLEFLRDIGKYFTVNSLVKKDAISARMQSDDGISFTEFTYPLLQAYDFWHLFRDLKCDVQIGGSDQWGNIVAGVELIRRKENQTAYALTIPIITDKLTGKKFGKSEGNAVWLDPHMTPPFQFFQFWLNVSDESVEEYLKLFTLLPLDEIENVIVQHKKDPSSRIAQQTLAKEVTALVHGMETANRAKDVSEILFGSKQLGELSEEEVEMLKTQAPNCKVQTGENIVDVLINSKLASSKREARQFLADGAIMLGSHAVADDKKIDQNDFKNGVALLKRGKRNVSVLVLR